MFYKKKPELFPTIVNLIYLIKMVLVDGLEPPTSSLPWNLYYIYGYKTMYNNVYLYIDNLVILVVIFDFF